MRGMYVRQMSYDLYSVGTAIAVLGAGFTVGAAWSVLDMAIGLAPGLDLRIAVTILFFAIGIPTLVAGLVVRRMFPKSSLRED